MKEINIDWMKPMLPKKFDENEWFAITITLIILVLIYYITVIRRELLWTEIIFIALFNLQMTTVGDYFLAMPPYDYYDTVDRNSGELTDIFLQNIVYPGTILILMHFYKKRTPHKLGFVIFTTILLSVCEAISVYIFNLYTYKSWKLYYSIFFYFFVMGLNLVYFEAIDKFIKKRISRNNFSQ